MRESKKWVKTCLPSWLLLVTSVIQVQPGMAATDKAPLAILSARYETLSGALRDNAFQRPLVLDSVELSNHIKGDVYARIDHPFSRVNTALQGATHWCDILILHQNTKYCKASSNGSETALKMMIGKKVSQSLSGAYEVNLDYRLLSSDQNYLAVQLKTDEGPMGTKNYRILLEAIPLPNNQTFLHFTYSYDYGFAGGMALKAYLATIGRHKVGFNRDQDTLHPGYIGGMRGMVERNTMRYYLAIDSYLGALSVSPEKQLTKRLQDWYTATERYPRQLHEISRSAYLAMKQEEIRRMASM
jgi:hypothetical protein